MKNSAKYVALAVASIGLLTACGSSDDTTANRDADVTKACTQSLAERQKAVGLETAKPLEGTTKIVATDSGWTMTGEVFALKGDSGAAGTSSQVRFECTAKDADGTIEASAFITLR